ncbi:hypothetical protein LuPra_05901 [Luteitalea pratensis]|uniref:Glycosyltransferase RgtA/B/C/D-like domain-containing protein n=1 Tax=Luteitalea pratensis TaxID=1855912 RepID=A0A143PX21_LUTPR|nr:hypothetical protein [Luteitalea pratensis]AMY12620.1 hypothetical protein LuPra_05901 [Luteitalea pratensis]
MTALRRLALPLAVLAWCALATASLVVALGPLSVPAIGVSISRATRLLAAAAVLAGAALWCRGNVLALLDDLASSRAPYVATLALTLVAFTALLSTHGAVNVGGADSAGYLAQAARWRDGQLRVPLPLAIPGIADPWVQSGLGLRPSATGDATVPTYPPGLPWLEAVALRLGGEFAAVRGLPWLAAMVGLVAAWLVSVPRTGYPGAALVVTSLATLPPFLYQTLQPMSDAPALAAWLLALALASRTFPAALVGAALATLVAIVIRPNLSPLVLVVAWQAWQAVPRVSAQIRRRRPVVRLLVVCAGAFAGVAAVAAVQASLYGSPVRSGYGRASDLFALRYVSENVRLYAAWFREGVAWPAGVVLLAGAACLAWRAVRQADWRPPAAMLVAVLVLYLVYIPFDSWTYLRFVLVPLALAPLGAAYVLHAVQESRFTRWTFPVTMVVLLAVALPNLRLARELTVFNVRAREYRYVAAGRYVADQLPATAVIVAVQHSASTPYYSGRPVIRPDLLAPDAFGTLVAWADRERRPLVFVLDESEPATLHHRFGDAALTALDWPPRAEIGRPIATRIWVGADREVYRAGGRIRTTRITDIPR